MATWASIPETCRRFVASTTSEMAARGVKVRLVEAEHADVGGSKVGGYFDFYGPEFVVATGKPPHLWLSVYVHEYCHFLQWVQDTPAWRAKLPGDCCPQEAFDAWLANVVEMTPDQLRAAVGLVLACEHECEQMALAIIALQDLRIAREWYVRAANVYLAWYGVVMQTRRWYDRSPYATDTLTAIVPGDRLIEVDEAMSPSEDFVTAARAACYTQGST